MNKAKNYKQKKSLKDRKTFSLPRPNFFQRILLSSASSLSRVSAAHQIPSISRTIGYSAYKINAADYIYNSLPSVSDFFERAKKYNVDLRYSIYPETKGKISRLFPPPKGQNFMININFHPWPIEREIINAVFEEYNQIFSVINPLYHFEVNFNPSKSDIKRLHSVTIDLDGLDKNCCGTIETIEIALKSKFDSCEPYSYFENATKKGIQLNSDWLGYYNYLKSTLQHEFAHLLGLADDYLLEKPFINTIMSYAPDNTCLSQNDLMILDCLYRNPENELSDAEIVYKLNEIYTASLGKNFNNTATEIMLLKHKLNAPVFKCNLSNEALDLCSNFHINPGLLKIKPEISDFQEELDDVFFKPRLLSKNAKIHPLGKSDFYAIYEYDGSNDAQHEFISVQDGLYTNLAYDKRKNGEIIQHDDAEAAVMYEANGIYFTFDPLSINNPTTSITKYYAVDGDVFQYTIDGNPNKPKRILEYLGKEVSKEEFFDKLTKLDAQKNKTCDDMSR